MEQTEKLLTNAAEEIKHLRAANREMSIRLQMFDQCMLLLTAHVPQRGYGEAWDIVHAIDKHIAEQEQMEREKGEAILKEREDFLNKQAENLRKQIEDLKQHI